MPRTVRTPHVAINMAISADGKISTRRREQFSLGSREDRYVMDVLRARADAVIIGATTLRLDGWAIRVRDNTLRAKRQEKHRSPHPLNVVLSTRLDVTLTRQFFTHPETEKLVITTRAAPAQRIKRVEKFAEVVVLRRKRVRPIDVLTELSKKGKNRVLVEGGGELNFSFFESQLVDEIFITVTPRIIGGAMAPTAVDGKGFVLDSLVNLRLVSSRRRGDEVFLRYRVIK